MGSTSSKRKVHPFEAGARILVARSSLKLSQEALARELGVSTVAVAKWERNERFPRPANLVRLAQLSGKPISWFYDGDGTKGQA